MKKTVTILILLLLTACTPIQEDKRLKVYTSFYPMYDFTYKIGQDKINLINLVPSGTEVHDWEIRTKEMIGLESADILIYNGLGMEYWLNDVVNSLENKDLILVNTTKNITTINDDPHVWLNVRNAIAQLTVIKDALVSNDVQNKDFYESNYNFYVNEFNSLHNQFMTKTAAFTKKDLVVAHEAFAYLCAEYGLNQVGVENVFAESEPDFQKLEEIINFIKDNDVTTIFYEPLGSSDIANTIAAETGIKVAVLNPLEGLTTTDINNNEDYISIMKQNLLALEDALK
jgi:zinc transport system substrate-binding protein